MKMRLLFISLLLLTVPVLYAQDLSKTETAIKQVIEDETHQINQKNYDGWAANWVHGEDAYFSVSGPDQNLSMTGWDKISAWAKKRTSEGEAQDYDQKKSDYTFRVGDDMAYVTFSEDGNRSSRVLVKEDKQWKIIRMDVVVSTEYRKKAWEKGFQQSVGTWKPQEGTLKNTNTLEIKLKDVTYYVKTSGHNYLIKMKEHWLEADGTTSWVAEEFRIPMYMENEVSITHNVFSDDWSTLASGTCKYLQGGGIEIHTTRIYGGTKYCDWKIVPNGKEGQVKLTAVYYNREEEEIMNSEMVVVKQD